MLRSDRYDCNLIRIEPERESALEVLCDDADETLERTEDGSVDNDRHLLSAVLVDICELEVMRELEVELDCTALPLTAKSILDLKVDLRAVERAVAFVDLVVAVTILLVKDSLQRSLSSVPGLDITHEVIRSCRELSSVCNTECLVDLVCNSDYVLDLVLDLLRCYECMVIVLTEFLYSEETVHLA